MAAPLDPVIKEKMLKGIEFLSRNPKKGVTAAALATGGLTDRQFRRYAKHPEVSGAFDGAKDQLRALVEEAAIKDLLTNPRASAARASYLDRGLAQIGADREYTEPERKQDAAAPGVTVQLDLGKVTKLLQSVPQAEVDEHGRALPADIPAEVLNQNATGYLIEDAQKGGADG